MPKRHLAFAGVAPPQVGLVEPPDGLAQRLALNEAHGVGGDAIRVVDQPVDRHDAGVLQAPGELGLQDEALPAVGVVGPRGPDALEGHRPVQLQVLGDVDLAQAAPGVEPQGPVAR